MAKPSALATRWLREPLLHFALLGALLFFAYGRVAAPEAPPDVIRLDAEDVRQLSTLWSRQYFRAPTSEELRELVAQRVREEILYREALALGLDRDDPIVRRRLAQKLEFLSEDLGDASEPDEAALRADLAAHADRYRIPDRLRFEQIYFDTDTRGAEAEAAARTALATLRADPELDPRTLGDRFLLDPSDALQSRADARRSFGKRFADDLFAIASDEWTGPLESAYGLHLVRVRERVPGRMPTLDEVRDELAAAVRAERRAEANAAYFASLRARYRVEIDDPRLEPAWLAGSPREAPP